MGRLQGQRKVDNVDDEASRGADEPDRWSESVREAQAVRNQLHNCKGKHLQSPEIYVKGEALAPFGHPPPRRCSHDDHPRELPENAE